MGIPQYNALKDPSCEAYFKKKGLPKYAEKAQEQLSQGGDDVNSEATSSMMGPVFDQFLRSSSAKQYLKEREAIGSGNGMRIHCAIDVYTNNNNDFFNLHFMLAIFTSYKVI